MYQPIIRPSFNIDSIFRTFVRVLRTKKSIHNFVYLLHKYRQFRKSILIAVWQIPSAVAHNIRTLLIPRALAGFSGAAFLSVAGGSITDMWTKSDISWPMGIYTLGPFLGPTLGPLVSGFINQNTSWRWTFYVIMICVAVEVCPLLRLNGP